jgi:hypothetical protein
MKSKPAERSFPFLKVNQRETKPQTRGLTEIRERTTPYGNMSPNSVVRFLAPLGMTS